MGQTVALPNDYSVTAPEIPAPRADGPGAFSAATSPTTLSTAGCLPNRFGPSERRMICAMVGPCRP